jgi:hypothetical protein
MGRREGDRRRCVGALGNGLRRAVWYDRQGPAHDVLASGEVPTPQPGSGEVRVGPAHSSLRDAHTEAAISLRSERQ